MISLTLVLSAN